jgi:hypothetical protein
VCRSISGLPAPLPARIWLPGCLAALLPCRLCLQGFGALTWKLVGGFKANREMVTPIIYEVCRERLQQGCCIGKAGFAELCVGLHVAIGLPASFRKSLERETE